MRKFLHLLPVVFILLACLFKSAAQADSSLERGVVLYQKENYDEAIAILKKVRSEDPASTRAAYYLGLALKRTEDYRAAKPHLIAAVTNSPKIKEALLELIEVLLQLDQTDEAKKWIAVCEDAGIRPAQTAFLNGMVLGKAAKNADAVKAFAKAMDLDVKLKQASEYQIGMIRLKEKQLDTAQKAFQTVQAMDPNTDLAGYANEYIKAIAKKQEEMKVFHANAGFATEFDSNVVLAPSDTTAAQNISDSKDFREVVTGGAEYNKRWRDNFSTRFFYSLYLANEEALSAFDLHSHTWGVVPNIYQDKTVWSFPTQVNVVWVDRKQFLNTEYSTPTWTAQFGDSQLAQIACKIQGLDYTRSPLNADEDRDGMDVVPGIGWFYFYDDNKGFVNLHYDLDIMDARGNNWAYLGNRLTASLVIPLWDKLKASQVGDLFLQRFDNVHTVFHQRRNDTVFTLSTLVSYTLRNNTDAQLRYTYVRDNANIPLFKYTRRVFSMGMAYAF